MTGQTGFYKITLPSESNLFAELLNSVTFENVANGRIGNHLVDVSEKGIPLVRTTSRYTIPAHNFSSIHHRIVEEIKTGAQDAGLPQPDFNNALIEVYDQHYTKMKYHSDQNLDLDMDSYVALFSCYEHPDQLSEESLRILKVKDKITLEETTIPLSHNSVVLFSLSTNRKYLHKIVPESAQKMKASVNTNRWLGITFRKSASFIQFKNDQPQFLNGEPLVLANEQQESEFFKLRGEENKSMNFTYPDIYYTLSIGDILKPIGY